MSLLTDSPIYNVLIKQGLCNRVNVKCLITIVYSYVNNKCLDKTWGGKSVETTSNGSFVWVVNDDYFTDFGEYYSCLVFTFFTIKKSIIRSISNDCKFSDLIY